jgi:hypothetical protein
VEACGGQGRPPIAPGPQEKEISSWEVGELTTLRFGSSQGL